MKKYILPFAFLLFLGAGLFAQSPDAVNYQGVARDATGNPLVNQAIGLRFSIRSGSTSGNLEYQETQSATTNSLGLFNLKIGQGNVVTGVFGNINWGGGSHWIEVEMDPSGGSSYQTLSNVQLVSVPYALHATTVEIDQVDDADADPANELQTLSGAGAAVTLSNGGGTVNVDVNDADSDPSNELQTLSISADTLSISGGNFVVLPSGGGSDADWMINGGEMSNIPGEINIGRQVNGNQLISVGDSGLFRMQIGHAGNFNEAESGRLVFSEDVNFAGTCGFEWHHDGAANTLSLESGCTTLGDTSIVFTRTGEVRIVERVRVGDNNNPACDIHVKQSSNGTAPSGAGIRFEEANTTLQYQLWTGGGNLNFAFNGTQIATIANNGAYSQVSDRRMKANILPLSSVLSSVMALKPVEYNYKHLSEEQRTKGFIAQEVQAIFPDMVTTSTGSDLLALPYGEFSVVAIKAIQEQQAIITDQQAQIDALKAEVDELKELKEMVKQLQEQR